MISFHNKNNNNDKNKVKNINFKKEISISILSYDFTKIDRLIKKINGNKKISCLHYDVMDGHFVNKISFGSDILKNIKNKIKIPIDAHLMVTNPDRQIIQFVKAGANLITISFEALYYREIKNILLNIKSFGIKSGIAINPRTNIEQIYEFLDYLDEILIMSVKPGKGGQKFIESTYDKIKKISNYFIQKEIKNIKISVDGGINNENAKKCFTMGANKLIVGSYLTNNENIDVQIEKLKIN